MSEHMKRQLTSEDLDLIFLRAQDDDSAEWHSISAQEATNLQFDTWAKTRIEIQGEDAPWSPDERANFCNMLWQADALVMLKRDVDDA